MQLQNGISSLLLIARLVLCYATTTRTRFLFMDACVYTMGPLLDEIFNVESHLACSARCAWLDACRALYYNRGRKSCHISNQTASHLMIMTTVCPAELVLYGELKQATHLDGWIGDTCSSNGDCPQANASCIQSTCKCGNGYSYRHRDDSCVDLCRVYGSSFKEEDQYILYNNRDFEYNLTETACLQYCLDFGQLCRFVEWVDESDGKNGRIGTCTISNETALTLPLWYRQQTNPGDEVQYLRGCA